MLLSEFDDQNGVADTTLPQLDRLVSLQRLWESKCIDGRLPAKSDFPPEAIKPWLGHILLVDVANDPIHFRVRLMGVKLVNYGGTDLRENGWTRFSMASSYDGMHGRI